MSEERKEYRKGYYQKNKKRWKKKYAADSEQLDKKKEYLRQYYKENKERWKNEDGTWKHKHSSKEYYRRKKIGGRRLNKNQKRFKKSLDQGADIERAIKIAYPQCNTPRKVDNKLISLRRNDYLAITIEDYHKLHSDVGLTPFKSAVKRNIIVDKVTEESDPKTDGNAIRIIEWMDRLGRKVDQEVKVGVNIAIFQYSEEKRMDMERIIDKDKERRGKDK